MTKALSPSQALDNLELQSELIDHFHGYTDTHIWTKTDGDSGASVAIDADGVGGVLLLTTGATDNNEAYVASAENFKFLASRPLSFVALLQYAESATDDANVAAGFMDAVGANSLQDDGAGPKASYSGAVFFKADGDTVWSVETSIGSTQTTTQTNVTAGGTSQQKLEIHVQAVTSTTAEVIFKVDNKPCRDSNGYPIVHRVSIGSATEMSAFVGVKAGSASSEVVSLDAIGAVQKS